jgi:hypothetical protein
MFEAIDKSSLFGIFLQPFSFSSSGLAPLVSLMIYGLEYHSYEHLSSFQVKFFSTVFFVSIKMRLSFIFVLAAITSSSLAVPLPGQGMSSMRSSSKPTTHSSGNDMKAQLQQQAKITQMNNHFQAVSGAMQSMSHATKNAWSNSRLQRRGDEDIFRRQEEIDDISIE